MCVLTSTAWPDNLPDWRCFSLIFFAIYETSAEQSFAWYMDGVSPSGLCVCMALPFLRSEDADSSIFEVERKFSLSSTVVLFGKYSSKFSRYFASAPFHE